MDQPQVYYSVNIKLYNFTAAVKESMYIVQNRKVTINPMFVTENDELICLGECSKRAQLITSIYAVETVF